MGEAVKVRCSRCGHPADERLERAVRDAGAAWEQVAVLRKALAFYADPEQWGRHGDAVADAGKVARSALSVPRTGGVAPEGRDA